jgi:hypothetical protein
MNKYQMRKYSDEEDRALITEWFSDNHDVVLTPGGHYDVDLEGDEYDIEISHLSFEDVWYQYEKEGRFRIEIRKRNHYWDGTYNKTHTTHFVVLNKKANQFLLFPQDLIMEYTNNEVELGYLKKLGFNLKERTFMCIPFDAGKDIIKKYDI